MDDTQTELETTTREPIRLDAASPSMRRRWAKKLADGRAKSVIIYVGGQWSVSVQRGNKRMMRVNLG
jgi:hypothetical protein